MTDFIMNPWPWWFSGIIIAAVMFTLLYFGKSFGFSSNLRTLCAVAGAGKKVSFFQFNWKSQIWNLVFLVGAVIGGFVASEFLTSDKGFVLAETTKADLGELGFAEPTGIQPEELFSIAALSDWKNILILIIGGILVGFGSRYAGGCTSGHAISGISDLQVPSIIAVIGFFIGGLLMTHALFPIIF